MIMTYMHEGASLRDTLITFAATTSMTLMLGATSSAAASTTT